MRTTEPKEGHSARPSRTPEGAPTGDTAGTTLRDQGVTMQAVALGPNGLDLVERPRPELSDPADALVEVQAAGLCRTDLYVASGELPAAPGVVLGHEAAGIVRELGAAATSTGLSVGTLVGVDPRIPCGDCAGCRRAPSPDHCLTPMGLGVDVDGVFADFVRVPAACLYPLDASVSPLRAAYLEPVAAAMGALTAGLTPMDSGVIAGAGRIAELTARIFEYSGAPRPKILAPEAFDSFIPEGTLDFVIDAGLPCDAALNAMGAALRKGGTLVLKSRTTHARSFVPAEWVAREITVAARSYGRFEDAARAVADERLVLEDLFGIPRGLADFERVFSDARDAEGVKQFFQLGGAKRVR